MDPLRPDPKSGGTLHRQAGVQDRGKGSADCRCKYHCAKRRCQNLREAPNPHDAPIVFASQAWLKLYSRGTGAMGSAQVHPSRNPDSHARPNPDRDEAEPGSGRRTLISGAARVADHQHAPPPAAAAGVPDLDVGGLPDEGNTEGDDGARGSVVVAGRRRSTLLAEPLLGGRRGPQVEGPEDLSILCKGLVARLPSCASAHSVKLSLLHGSFSGAKVLLMTPIRADRCELPTSVIKYDQRKEIADEVVMTNTHGPRWGPAHPRVLGVQKGEKWAVMQLA